jgi:predicted FMN-binding regulatory protein PaiB
MSNKTVDSPYLWVVFSRFIHVVASAALALTITTPDKIDIPHDVIKDMVLCVIWEINIKSLSGKSTMSKSKQDTDL